jgi:hypothetical protein
MAAQLEHVGHPTDVRKLGSIAVRVRVIGIERLVRLVRLERLVRVRFLEHRIRWAE